jgi:plasmid stabilization system protein ParE
MPRRLSYTDDALADLSAIRGWLSQPGSGVAARRRLMAIRASIRRLRDHPCLGAIGDHPGVRELPCDGGYRALYRLHPYMRVQLSTAFLHVKLRVWIERVSQRFGSGAVLNRSNDCVTLHAVGSIGVVPHHNASCTRRGPSETRPT